MARNGFRKMPVSMRGVTIDMDAMRASNESSVAVGNAKMNARGDIMGPKGQIEVRREQIAREYLANNPQSATQVSLKPAVPDHFETVDQAVSRLNGKESDRLDTPKDLGKKPRKLVNKDDD